MDAISVGDIMESIEKIAPQTYAQSYDNVGLLIGDAHQTVKNIVVGLEVTDSLIDEAIQKDCELIIVHHPLIFSPLKQITYDNPISKKIMRLIKADISLYVAHTNLDKAKGGLNDYLCEQLGFQPNVTLDNQEPELIRICDVEEQLLSALMGTIKDKLRLQHLRYISNTDSLVKRVGICSGSGMSLFMDAVKHGIDVYITGDVKYHDAVLAKEIGVSVIDAGHYATEIICRQLFENILEQTFASQINVYQHQDFWDPIHVL